MATILLAGLACDLESTIRRALTSDGHEVVVACDAPRMVQVIGQTQTNLAILDSTLLAGSQGFQLRSDLWSRPAGQNLFTIVISIQDTMAAKLDAFAAGADDYLVVPFHMPELLLRIAALLRRQARLRRVEVSAHPLRRHGDFALDVHTGHVWRGDRRVVVTPVEARLLDYLMDNAGRAVSAEELLQHVWTQSPGCGDPALVRVHIRHLRAKLADLSDHEVEAVRTIPRFGYCLAPVVAA